MPGVVQNEMAVVVVVVVIIVVVVVVVVVVALLFLLFQLLLQFLLLLLFIQSSSEIGSVIADLEIILAFLGTQDQHPKVFATPMITKFKEKLRLFLIKRQNSGNFPKKIL